MNYNAFTEWLINDRKMSVRSAKDVTSRLKRCLKLTNQDVVDDKTESVLSSSSEFGALTSFVKAQLKRSITLYMEFSKK